MAGKPVHAGHWQLIKLASIENDVVELFVSTGDRENIAGSTMKEVWERFLTPSLPTNVVLSFVKVPVKSVYDRIGAAEARREQDEYFIYSDADDILKYKSKSLLKEAKNTFEEGRIHLRGISRLETTNVSGSELRKLLRENSKKKFIALLPGDVKHNGEAIWKLLRSSLLVEET